MMIRRLYGQEVLDALHLVWDVFVQDVAPCYTEEGVKAFSQFIRYENIDQKMRAGGLAIFGAYEGTQLKGAGAILPSGHIAFLFVKKEDQGRGVGRQIFQELCNYAAQTFHVTKITVNAAPGSVEAYRHFGMREIAPEQVGDGIRYIPLEMWITPAVQRKDRKKVYLIIGAAVLCLLIAVISAVAVIREVRYVLQNQSSLYDWSDDGNNTEDWFEQMPYSSEGEDSGETEEASGLDAIDAYVSDEADYEVKEENYNYNPDDTTSTVIQFDVYYPQIEGLSETVQSKVNEALENCAMETVDKLYLNPSQETKEKVLSEDNPVLASFVEYKVTYQGKNMLSVVFQDYGYEGSMSDSFTALRCVNINLEDGTVYDVKDIVDLNDEFMNLWLEGMRNEAGEETLLSELTEDEWKEVLEGDSKDGVYDDNFFVDADGIEIGLSFRYADTSEANTRFAWVTAPFDLDDLQPYQTDSSFWKLLES